MTGFHQATVLWSGCGALHQFPWRHVFQCGLGTNQPCLGLDGECHSELLAGHERPSVVHPSQMDQLASWRKCLGTEWCFHHLWVPLKVLLPHNWWAMQLQGWLPAWLYWIQILVSRWSCFCVIPLHWCSWLSRSCFCQISSMVELCQWHQCGGLWFSPWAFHPCLAHDLWSRMAQVLPQEVYSFLCSKYHCGSPSFLWWTQELWCQWEFSALRGATWIFPHKDPCLQVQQKGSLWCPKMVHLSWYPSKWSFLSALCSCDEFHGWATVFVHHKSLIVNLKNWVAMLPSAKDFTSLASPLLAGQFFHQELQQNRVLFHSLVWMERANHTAGKDLFALIIQNPVGEGITNVVTYT